MNQRFATVEVPSLSEQDGRTFGRLVQLMRILLGSNGCPWDREQTHQSLRRYALEEACEVIDAIDKQDQNALRDELGDLLLQVVFHSELARSEGSFGPDDVVASICQKLVRRHPHVFATSGSGDAEHVHKNWDHIKSAEKPAGQRLLDDVPSSLPALVRAQRIGERVHRVGFDWPDAAGSRAKVAEEVAELDQAAEDGDLNALQEELGDVLFALVNLARHLKIDAEFALRATTDKFVRRFAHVETRARQLHGGFASDDGTTLPLEVLDQYWEEAKAIDKESAR